MATDPTKLGPGKAIVVKGSKLGAFLHVVSSAGDSAVPLSSSGSATLPSGIAGRLYLFTSDSKTLTDDNTNAGPAVVDLPDPKATRLFALGHQNVSCVGLMSDRGDNQQLEERVVSAFARFSWTLARCRRGRRAPTLLRTVAL